MVVYWPALTKGFKGIQISISTLLTARAVTHPTLRRFINNILSIVLEPSLVHWTKLFWIDVLSYKNKTSQVTSIIYVFCF